MENKKYDLEKAKEDCRRHEDALEEAQSCMCGHCHECGFDPSEMKAALDEVERLRSENKIISDRAAHHEKQDAAEIELLAARIKELEEANRNIDKRRDEMAAFIERLEAAFLKSETERKFYTTINGMNSEFDWNGYPECPQNGIHKEWFRQQAREALERIKEEREG